MAEQTPDVQTIVQALQGAMAQMKQMATPSVPQAPSIGVVPATQGFGIPSLTGWSVPVEQEINGMTVTLYLNFPAETFAQAPSIIMGLANSGLQVRAFQKGGNGGFGSNGGSSWGNRGGGFSGGGYNRGGYGRRW